LRSGFVVRWRATLVSLAAESVVVDPLAPMALPLPDAPGLVLVSVLVLPPAVAPEPVVPELPAVVPPLVPELPAAVPPVVPELPAAVPLVPELPGVVPELPAAVPEVPLAPGVPVEPIGVDCVLCWPAPVAGSGVPEAGGVLCASAVPAIATAAMPASTPLNGVDAVISETP
jgi:hypothetical protein